MVINIEWVLSLMSKCHDDLSGTASPILVVPPDLIFWY